MRIAIIMLVLLGILLPLASIKTYRVRETADGTLFWNAGEAYAFLNVGRSGVHLSYLQYIAEIVREWLGGVHQPDDKRIYAVVLHVTPQMVQLYTSDEVHPGSFSLLGTSVYSRDLVTGALWKWTGTRFETVNDEEERKLKSLKNPQGPDFDDFNGWSMRCCFFNRASLTPITIDGKTLTIVATKTVPNQFSITLERPDHNPQQVWYIDGRPRGISKSEYDKLFAQH